MPFVLSRVVHVNKVCVNNSGVVCECSSQNVDFIIQCDDSEVASRNRERCPANPLCPSVKGQHPVIGSCGLLHGRIVAANIVKYSANTNKTAAASCFWK